LRVGRIGLDEFPIGIEIQRLAIRRKCGRSHREHPADDEENYPRHKLSPNASARLATDWLLCREQLAKMISYCNPQRAGLRDEPECGLLKIVSHIR